MREISLEECNSAIAAAIAASRKIDVPMSIAIVDAGRNLIAFSRMDGALLGTIEVAQAKAYTARTVNMRTSALAPLIQPGQPLYGFVVSHRQPLVMFGGGVPVTRGGKVVGAVGASGGSVEQDEMVADVAARVLEHLSA